MSGWRDRARTAENKLQNAKHGEREQILSTIGRGLNPNTVRREKQALVFANRLSARYPALSQEIEQLSFPAVELLARWSSFDERGAMSAGRKAALGEPLCSLKTDMQAARKAYAIPTRQGHLNDLARVIAGPAGKLLAGRLKSFRIPSKRIGGPPVDLIFDLVLAGGVTESVAVVTVGPFGSDSLYRKRMQDVLWHALGLAWQFSHVVVLLPSPSHVAAYQRWLDQREFDLATGSTPRARGSKAGVARRPSVRVLGLNAVEVAR